MQRQQPESYVTVNFGEATLEAYRETRRGLLLAADRITRQMSERESVRSMEEMETLLRLDRERKLLVEMISDCSYVIEWLETGRRPGNRRGIERRAAYQREIPTDPARLPVMVWVAEEADEPSPLETELKQFRLEAALRGLTARERECYVLAHGHGCTYAEIAELLQISKSSVGTYVVRAGRKIANNVGSVVLVG